MVKPTKLDGLFSFALVSGLVLAIQIHTGMDVSETGIGLMIIENVSKVLGNPIPELLPMVSVLFATINGGIAIHHVKTAIQHRKRGVLVSSCGFFGILALILGSLAGVSVITFLGIILCLLGAGTSAISRT